MGARLVVSTMATARRRHRARIPRVMLAQCADADHSARVFSFSMSHRETQWRTFGKYSLRLRVLR